MFTATHRCSLGLKNKIDQTVFFVFCTFDTFTFFLCDMRLCLTYCVINLLLTDVCVTYYVISLLLTDVCVTYYVINLLLTDVCLTHYYVINLLLSATCLTCYYVINLLLTDVAPRTGHMIYLTRLSSSLSIMRRDLPC